MSRVKFDVESDGRFLDSVKDLGIAPATRVLSELKQMHDCISWTAMIKDYGWHELIVPTTDSFPRGNRLFSFILSFRPLKSTKSSDIITRRPRSCACWRA